MAINPTGSKGPQAPDPRRTDGTARGERLPAQAEGTERTPAASRSTQDVVELSASAADAVQPGEIPTNTLPAERLREIARRLADGTYDTPAVRDAVADRLLNDLEAPGA